MTVVMTNPALKVDPEFQAKIPPLTDEEYRRLEENILAAGEVFDAIVTWNDVIIDGHNRWKIIQSHPEANIKYRTREMLFTNRWEAIDWMYSHQLGRRNLTDEQKTYLLGKLYEARKHVKSGAPKGNQNAKKKQRMQNECVVLRRTPRTHDIVAKEQGVNASTVQRAEHFAKGIDAIRTVSPETASDILSGKKGISKVAIKRIGTAPASERPTLINAVIEGKPLPKSSTSFKPSTPSSIKPSVASPDETKPEPVDFSNINWRSAEGRRVKEQIDQAIRNSYSDETPEFTLPMLIEELNLDVQDFTDKLSRMLSDRADIITESIRIETKNLLHNLKKYKEALNNGK